MFALDRAPKMELLDELERAVNALSSFEPTATTGDARRSMLVQLHKTLTRLDAQRMRLIAALDRAGDAQTDGILTTNAWLQHRCDLTEYAAVNDVRTARRLPDFEAFADAFAAGEITRAHVDLFMKEATDSDRVAGLQQVADTLLQNARHFPPGTFARVVKYACERIDGDRGRKGAWRQIKARRLHLSSTIDGMGVFDALLDPESTEILTRALELFMREDSDGENESRTIAQRRADALVNMAKYATSCKRKKQRGRRARPEMIVAADLERFVAPELVDGVRAEVHDAGRLSTETLLRIACDCDISRVLTAGPSEILDVGRSVRVVTDAQFRALVIRDGGCTHPGCQAPPWMCEAHHIVHWLFGGATDLANLKLLCWRHHRDHHEGTVRHE